jgi:hypothetical protein
LLASWLAAPAYASTPLEQQVRPAEEQNNKPSNEKVGDSIERRVEQLERACSVSYLERVPRPRRECPDKMAAVEKLGERALPTLVAHVMTDATGKGRPMIGNNRADILIGVIGRIGGKPGLAALLQLSGEVVIQKNTNHMFESVHYALEQATKTKLNFADHTPEGRAKVAAQWRAVVAAGDKVAVAAD